MTQRTISQKIGARGHKWLMGGIEEHPSWLARELGEDYGVDIEAELTEAGVRGEILKIQIKSMLAVKRTRGSVAAIVDKKYAEYAQSCRYPVVLIIVDITAKQAWFLWLQEWLLQQRAAGRPQNRRSFTVLIPVTDTLEAGLNDKLKQIAQWKGETQLVLSLPEVWCPQLQAC